PEQALVAIEDQGAAQGPEEDAHCDQEDAEDDGPRRRDPREPGAGGGQGPARPGRGAGQLELDARAGAVADLHRAEPVEHGTSLRPEPRAGYEVDAIVAGDVVTVAVVSGAVDAGRLVP